MEAVAQIIAAGDLIEPEERGVGKSDVSAGSGVFGVTGVVGDKKIEGVDAAVEENADESFSIGA